jgi:molybdate transport system regulatory protein
MEKRSLEKKYAKNTIPRFRLWLEREGAPILGRGGARLLEEISKTGTLQQAIKNIQSETKGTRKMSYRYAWGMLRSLEKRLGYPVVQRTRGGTNRGGTKLTVDGEKLLARYNHLSAVIQHFLDNDELSEMIDMKISARNQIKGQIEDIAMDGITAKITIKVTEPTLITSVITRESVEKLELKKGDAIQAIIKSTEVMVAKE